MSGLLGSVTSFSSPMLGSGGLLERLKSTGADVIGLDWTLDVADARDRLGRDIAVQVSLRLVTLQLVYIPFQWHCFVLFPLQLLILVTKELSSSLQNCCEGECGSCPAFC